MKPTGSEQDPFTELYTAYTLKAETDLEGKKLMLLFEVGELHESFSQQLGLLHSLISGTFRGLINGLETPHVVKHLRT